MAKVSPIGRASYPSIFEPKAFGNADPKFEITLIFDPTVDLSIFHRAIEKTALAKFGEVPDGLVVGIKDGDPNKKESAGKKTVKFSASEKRPPQVVGPDNNQIEENSGLFYAGCHARVSWTAYAWEFKTRKGVSFSLNNVQKTGDDEAFDGRTTALDDFGDLDIEMMAETADDDLLA